MNERKGNWSQTFTGRRFFVVDPRPEDICIEDIAHALALQCRFAGHCRVPYSVSEHSVRVSDHLWHATNGDRVVALAGLLHDASEAYCVDVPRPLKPYLDGYASIEGAIIEAVEAWAGLPRGACSSEAVKHADEVVLATEARDLMVITRPWHLRAEPLAETIEPWGWERAEAMLLARFTTLRGQRA